MSVLLRNLGRIAYLDSLKIQKELVQTYKNKSLKEVGVVLLCEHNPPVYTVGLRQKNIDELRDCLKGLKADIVQTRRGGLVTFHGLGQLVCYPIVNLHRLKLGVRDYISCLERAIIGTSLQYGIKACTTEHTGVWVDNKKICAIGVQVSMGVAHHGLALNCSTDLSWFSHIVPCGIEGKGVTSLTERTGQEITIDAVSPLLIKYLCEELQVSILSE